MPLVNAQWRVVKLVGFLSDVEQVSSPSAILTQKEREEKNLLFLDAFNSLFKKKKQQHLTLQGKITIEVLLACFYEDSTKFKG